MIFLGVDGGGTKTHALAVDEQGTIIGFGVSGESNYQIIGLDAAAASLAEATQQALGDLCADKAVYCLAGCDTELDNTRLNNRLTEIAVPRYFSNFSCYNDSFAALRAGTQQPFGVAVICGTGFNACGIAPDGRQARLHSLGPLTGDWGGGYALGEGIFGAVYRAAERRGAPTLLTDLLLEALHVPDLLTVTHKLIDEQISYAEIGNLAPLVFTAAARGDAVARALIIRQADEIVIAARAIIAQLDMDDVSMDVILAGGVVNGEGTLLIDSVRLQIAQSHPHLRVSRLNVSPVVGAVLMACDALSVKLPRPLSLMFDGDQGRLGQSRLQGFDGRG